MTRHLSQIGLTLGLTFTFPILFLSLLVPVNDPTAGQVIGRQLHYHSVLRQDADVVLPHLAADMGKYLVSVLQLNAKHRIGQGFDHPALDLDGSVFLSHILRDSYCLLRLSPA
ncbi:hypothetical protein BKG80_12205 [Mycobacteroides chelonae]|nr:hypothetical protein BKG80_12205 [Mycobacteroides chelonae]